MQLHDTFLSYDKDLTWLVINLQDDKHDSVVGGGGMKAEALEVSRPD